MEGEDRDQHGPRGELLGRPGRRRVGDEHQGEGRDQGEEAELQAGAGEWAGERRGQRPQRGGEEQFASRRREADEQAGGEEARQAELGEAGRGVGGADE